MQAILGLVLFSVLLAPGSSLMCPICTAIGDSCTGTIERCGYGEDACVSVWMEITTEGIPIDTITKRCLPRSACADIKSGLQDVIQRIAGVGAVVKKVECNRAPYSGSPALPSSGSLLLALSGFLLLKLLS